MMHHDQRLLLQPFRNQLIIFSLVNYIRQKRRMKWVQIKLCAVGLLVGGMPGVEAKLSVKGRHSDDPSDPKMKQDTVRRRAKKDSPSESSDDTCPTCNEQLPGYSLFGDFYFDWLDDDGFNPEPLIVDGLSPCQGKGIFLCALVSLIAEAIYSIDITRCLLLSLAKTARETVCFIQDRTGVPNPDVVGSNIMFFDDDDDVVRNRKLTEKRKLTGSQEVVVDYLSSGGAPYSTTAPLLEMVTMLGITDMEQLMTQLNVDMEPIMRKVATLHSDPPTRRKLQDLPLEGLWDFINDEIEENLDADLLQALTGNAFFLKCSVVYGAPRGVCLGIFALLKTIDASVCYYQEELQCSVTETCTADVKFTTEYNQRRLANYIPGVFEILSLGNVKSTLPPFLDGTNFLLADIIAPCVPCADKKTGGCSGFCNFVEDFHTCDPAKRAWVANFGQFIPL
jgi:hypothetical protein